MPSSANTLADPFVHISKEFMDDPYPIFHRLRAEAPVFWSEKGRYWLVTRYADAHHILRDGNYEKGIPHAGPVKNFIVHMTGGDELKESVANWVALKNPPEHTRIRSTANKAFTPTMITRMRPSIQDIANHLIDELEKKQEFDLVSEYAFELPVRVIAKMLGVPADDIDKLHQWSNILTGLLEPRQGFNPGRMHKMVGANREFIDYLRPLVEERKKNPQEDLISDLLAAQDSANKLTEEELLANCVFMLIAGHETTVNLIGNGVHALVTNPEQLALIKENPDLTPQAVEEALRYQCPVQMVRRIAHQDLELGGHKIAKEDLVIISLGACNRDPAVFPNPDKFDISRKDARHLAFGEGVHFCLGASLARAEADIAFRTLFDRLPGLKLKTTSLEYKDPFGLRGFKEIPVTVK